MDMRCCGQMNAPIDLNAYRIEKRIEEVFIYYRLPNCCKERFLEMPEIQDIKKILKAVDMSVDQITDYLGEDFRKKWGGDEDYV